MNHPMLFAPGIPLIDQPGFMSPGLTLIIYLIFSSCWRAIDLNDQRLFHTRAMPTKFWLVVSNSWTIICVSWDAVWSYQLPSTGQKTQQSTCDVGMYIYIYYGCCILISCEGLVMAASTLDIFEWTYRMPNKNHTNHPSYRQCAKCKPFPKEAQPTVWRL